MVGCRLSVHLDGMCSVAKQIANSQGPLWRFLWMYPPRRTLKKQTIFVNRRMAGRDIFLSGFF